MYLSSLGSFLKLQVDLEVRNTAKLGLSPLKFLFLSQGGGRMVGCSSYRSRILPAPGAAARNYILFSRSKG